MFLRPKDIRTQGLKELNSGDAELGESLLEEHLKQHPSDSATRKQLVDNYIRFGPPEKALEHLKVLSTDPQPELEALRMLAALAIKSGDISLAEKTLGQLLKFRSEDFAANLALAELFFNSGRPLDAIPFIEASIKAQPKRAAGYLLLADALGDAGRNQEMIKPLEACLELSPDEFTAHANLAFAYYTAGRSDEAIQHAQWCLARQPGFQKVRLVLAQAERDNGEYDAALLDAEAILASEPHNLDAALLQSDLLFFRGDGRDVYDRLIPFYEQHQESRKLISHLMRAAVAKGDRDKAKHWQKILTDLIPDKD